jgi:hypothetical protein
VVYKTERNPEKLKYLTLAFMPIISTAFGIACQNENVGEFFTERLSKKKPEYWIKDHKE